MLSTYETIPQSMRKEKRWLVFKLIKETTQRGIEKTSKKPVNPNDLHYGASSTDSSTWSDFETAISQVGKMSTAHNQLSKIQGIGFVLGDGWAGVDLDGGPGHITEGFTDDMFQDIYNTLKTYCEVSVSGNGYHFIGRYTGDKFKKCRKDCIEIYTSGRFFAMTGNRYGDYEDPVQFTDGLKEVYHRYIDDEDNLKPKQKIGKEIEKLEKTQGNVDYSFLKRALHDRKFNKLWNATFQENEYESESEADAALMSKLIYFAGRDKDKCCKAFMGSPYAKANYRDKLIRPDYLPLTFDSMNQGIKQTFDEKSKRENITIESVSETLKLLNMQVKLNVITREIQVIGKTQTGRALEYSDLIVLLQSEMTKKYNGCGKDTIAGFVEFIAKQEQYNPVLDYLESLHWDGKSRLDDLYDLMGINDSLSKELVYKWLCQCIALQYNSIESPFGAEGVLVLNGPQGYGKTSFLSYLAIRQSWFGEGEVINEFDKDTTRRIVTKWIAELGEVERSLKNNIEGIRAFVTSKLDEYRLPYERSDTRVPRHTSMAATCNSEQYLTDPEGNRRWWTIAIQKKITHEQLKKFDFQQLWAEVYSSVKDKEKSSCFRLSNSQFNELQSRNRNHEKLLPAQAEILDIFGLIPGQKIVYSRQSGFDKNKSASEFKEEHEKLLRAFDAWQIGRVLKKLGFEQIRGRKYRMP